MNSRVLKKAIHAVWVILIVCLVVKAFAGNWFSMNITSTWLERNTWASIFVFTATSYIMFTLYYLAICEVRRFKWWIHVALLPYFFLISLSKVMWLSPRLFIVIDIISNFAIPAILVFMLNWKPKKGNGKKYARIVIAYIFNCGFQAISTMVRQVQVSVVVSNLLTEVVMSLYVVIMLVLYWLYALLRKKEVEKMGYVFTFLLGKGKDELEKMLSEVDEKLAKDPDNGTLKEERAAIVKALEEI